MFTLIVSADLYRGVPAVYVNFLDHDVFAHAFGPTHRSAMRALHHIDNSIGQLARIVERLPELDYDLYVLSDHGQTLTRHFAKVSGGSSLEDVVRAVLGGAAEGPVCWWRGRRVALDGNGSEGPFAEREDRELVLSGLRDLMAMPSAGDLVVYGIGAPERDVSFIDERGSHAGPSENEMRTFIVFPVSVTLPAPLDHPVQLYAHFAAYRSELPAMLLALAFS